MSPVDGDVSRYKKPSDLDGADIFQTRDVGCLEGKGNIYTSSTRLVVVGDDLFALLALVTPYYELPPIAGYSQHE